MPRALLSVSDKSGIAEFAAGLRAAGWEILSTGGTAQKLAAEGIPVTEVSRITSHPEMMDGRVKTLHPAIHAGILARRSNPGDMEELARQRYRPIDLVAVNLYPFRETIRTSGVTAEAAMEQVDIGGPTLIRAAAKNHRDLWVVVDPRDYGTVLGALAAAEAGRANHAALRRRLAAKVFRTIAGYDRAVADWLESAGTRSDRAESPSQAFPDRLSLQLVRKERLRYGENPGQEAAFYAVDGVEAQLEQIHGKALSYNNLLDVDGALVTLSPFAFSSDPAVAIVKHTTPCGLAVRPELAVAFRRARATDPVSAFGSVIALNRPVDGATATELGTLFVECIAAPAFNDDALALLAARKNLRLLRFGHSPHPHPAEPVDAAWWRAYDPDLRGAARFLARCGGHPGARSLRSVHGGILAQTHPDPPFHGVDDPGWRIVTKRLPNPGEQRDLSFAWAAVAAVKSNAILLARDGATVGIGAGQMSRVDSSRLAAAKAREAGLGAEMEGCALASDAFFPFRDGVDAAAEAGVRAIVQPGGSIRDAEVIGAADEHGIAMIFTGRRLFRH